MAWSGGFTGVGLNRAEFKQRLSSIKDKPPYQRVVIHNTDAPYIKPPVAPSKRVQNISVHYKNMGWSGGPDLFAQYDGRVYPGSPFGKSVGCKGWNGNSLHIEAEGKYTRVSGHSPHEGYGKDVWDVMAWATAEFLLWMGMEATESTIRFHKEGNTTHKTCPGDLIDKEWFINKVRAEMGHSPFYPEPKPETSPNKTRATVARGDTGGQVPVLQKALKNLGYYAGAVDGDFGPKTDAAVRAFQAAYKLKVDGVVGPLTWDALSKAKTSQKPVEPPKPPEQSPPPETPKPAPGTKREPVEAFHMSAKGLDLLKHFEGLRLTPYDDRGSPAIGYGHSNRSEKPPHVTPDLRITAEEALQILANDLVDYENRVKRSVKVPLTQGEFDALVSLAYNWGPGNLDRSRLMTLLNEGKYKEAGEAILTILPKADQPHYKGIKRRRGEEYNLWISR